MSYLSSFWTRLANQLSVFRRATEPQFLLCSNCFHDQGLRLDAAVIGIVDRSVCSNCKSRVGRKLSKSAVATLAHRFFVWGTIHRWEYGATPVLQLNDKQSTSIDTAPSFEPDFCLFEKAIGVSVFYYSPRPWMMGNVEPLKALQDPASRGSIIKRILDEYPTITLTTKQVFYRIRKGLEKPDEFGEYDSPPSGLEGSGRLDAAGFPVMYGSQDLQICLHECRVTAEDDVYVATLAPAVDLILLDLTESLHEDDVAEFESLDMAIHMLFLAGEHSYTFSRDIAQAASAAGYDGLVYPSYFSLLRIGGLPSQTTFGISNRRGPRLAKQAKSKTIPNLALFGRPVETGHVGVRCVNKLILHRVNYGIHFGPVGYEGSI